MKVFLKSVLFCLLAVAMLATPLFAQKGKPAAEVVPGCRGSGCAGLYPKFEHSDCLARYKCRRLQSHHQLCREDPIHSDCQRGFKLW